MAWPVTSSLAPTTAASATGRVGDEGRLHLGGGDAVAADVHHVVDAPEQPEVAVVVELGAVAGEVAVGEAAPVRVAVPLGVAVDAPQHRRPRPGQREVAPADGRRACRRRRPARRRCPGSGNVAEPGFSVVQPGSGLIMMAARLGLPPRVDHRAAATADVLVVPHPGLGVDRLADRAEQAQAGQVVLGRLGGTPLHERPDGGGRGVEDGDAVLLDDRPTSGPGRGGRACPRTSRWWRRWPAGRRRCSCGPVTQPMSAAHQ